MLRRKLLIRIGLLVACFVAGAAVAIYLLQDTVPNIDRINRDAVVLIDGVHTIDDCISQIENARAGMPGERTGEGSPQERLAAAMASVGTHPAVRAPNSPEAAAFERLRTNTREYLAPGPTTALQEQMMRAGIRDSLLDLSRTVRAHVAAEQTDFSRYLRWLVLGLTLAALVMVNVAVFVLLRTAQVVLKPVGELVAGSRELAAEHFEHRVQVDQQDEFGELARAYNRLAEQLQGNEERKAETLRQLAVTINHDLNNAMATIEMQLSLLDRQSGRDKSLERYVRDIQRTLSQMSVRVASLKQIRRVVLTDYVDGQKMVDLEQSLTPAPAGGLHRGAPGDSGSSFRGEAGRDRSGV